MIRELLRRFQHPVDGQNDPVELVALVRQLLPPGGGLGMEPGASVVLGRACGSTQPFRAGGVAGPRDTASSLRPAARRWRSAGADGMEGFGWSDGRCRKAPLRRPAHQQGRDTPDERFVVTTGATRPSIAPRQSGQAAESAPNVATGVQPIYLQWFIEIFWPPCTVSCTISDRIGTDDSSRVWTAVCASDKTEATATRLGDYMTAGHPAFVSFRQSTGVNGRVVARTGAAESPAPVRQSPPPLSWKISADPDLRRLGASCAATGTSRPCPTGGRLSTRSPLSSRTGTRAPPTATPRGSG